MQAPGPYPARRMPRWVRVALRKTGATLTSIAGVLVGVSVVLLMFVPIIDGSRPGARQARCQSNLKQLASATLMYANDYDDRLPLRRSWAGGTSPYLKSWEVYVCPEAAIQAQPQPPSP